MRAVERMEEIEEKINTYSLARVGITDPKSDPFDVQTFPPFAFLVRDGKRLIAKNEGTVVLLTERRRINELGEEYWALDPHADQAFEALAFLRALAEEAAAQLRGEGRL